MTEQVELERAYVVCLDGMGCGTNAYDILVCRPRELDAILDTMAWEHHDQWFQPDEDDDGEGEEECQAGASAVEYTPENMDEWDCRRSGGGSFTEERGVKEVWQALGYGRPKFEGDSAFDALEYIKCWDIPVCQAGASWQMLEGWRQQAMACREVERVILGLGRAFCPPLLQTQLSGALAMAKNEQQIIDANVQKVIARLKAL